jgi:hypothetical protein
MRRSVIEDENKLMVRRQREFRQAADVLTDAFMEFPEIEAIAVIGSVVRPLWKEVPRFREFRRERIEIWHECGDLDLAVWITSLDRLSVLRRVRSKALRDAYAAGNGPGVVDQQAEIFLIEPGTNRYLGRLCYFNTCPKEKRDCLVPGCGTIPFNKIVDGFVPHVDLLAPAAHSMLYRRGLGRLMSALDLPSTDGE